MSNIISEGLHAAEYVIQEVGPRALTRKTVKLSGDGTELLPGTVLGKISASVAASIAAPAGNTGDADLSAVAITLEDGVLEGAYILTCTGVSTDGGTFSVTAPDGSALPDLTVGVAYSSTHLSFTLPDGATDWAIDDSVVITVSANSAEYKVFDPDASDGTEVADAILFRAVTPAVGVPADALVTARSTVVDKKALVWGSNVSGLDKITAFAALQTNHIIALD